MTTVSLRFDDAMKRELDSMCDSMGMNITTFFMIYAKRAIRDRRIPFDVVANDDPFYSEENMKQIEKARRKVAMGKTVTKTLDELETLVR